MRTTFGLQAESTRQVWARQIFALGLLLLLGCASQPAAPRIRVDDAWVRITVDQGAAYMVISNDGAASDTLVAVQSEIAGMAHLHRTVQKGDVMSMESVPRLEVPARGRVQLKPLDLHIMLTGVKQNPEPGQKVRLTLQFEKSGAVEVEAEVRQE